MPTHEGVGPDDCENLQDRRKPAIKQDKEPPIIVRKPDATIESAPHDIQLMSKHRVLSLKPQLRLEWRGQHGQNETEQPDHGPRGGVALALAHPGVHGVARIENRTKASTATLRTIIAIAPTSMMEIPLDAMRHFWQQSSGSVDLDHVRRPVASRPSRNIRQCSDHMHFPKHCRLPCRALTRAGRLFPPLSRPPHTWLKAKNPECEAVRRECEKIGIDIPAFPRGI